MSEWTEAESSSSGPIISETEPSNPSKGDEWVDESYRSPAKKIYMGDGEWATLVPGSNVPSEQTYTSGSHQIDVSDMTSTVTVELKGERGESAGGANGGNGAQIMAGVDLSRYDTLTVYAGNYEVGGSGDPGAGDGGASSAIEADGEVIVAAGGGGGAGAEDGGSYQYGGGGGGPGGGDGGPSNVNTRYLSFSGSNGSGWAADSVEIKNTGTATSPEAQLFIGGGGGKTQYSGVTGIKTVVFSPFCSQHTIGSSSMKSTSHNFEQPTVDGPLDQPTASPEAVIAL